MIRALAVVCLLALASGLPAAALNTSHYRIESICPLNQYNSFITGINNSGQVSGYSDPGSFIWQNGQIQSLAGLGGSVTRAMGINNKGQVTGYTTRASSSPEVPVIWQSGGIQIIGSLGGDNAYGYGINESGVVSGYSQLPAGGTGHAYTWSPNGALKDMGIASQATRINDLGEVIGFASSKAFIWRNNQITYLGSLGYNISHALGMNNSSQVVGSANVEGVYDHAFIWQNGVMTDLDPGPQKYSAAFDINEGGIVVGHTGWSGSSACMWVGTSLIDLNTRLPANSGWVLTQATEINDRGQIAGMGLYNGQYAGWIMTQVPEPSSLLALLAGLVAMPALALRRRG